MEKREYYIADRSWDYLDLVDDVIAGIDIEEFKNTEDEYDFVSQEMDNSELIYTHNQWTMIEEWFSPDELTENTFGEAWNHLADDILDALHQIIENEKTTDNKRRIDSKPRRTIRRR